jgi:hypothetical protein
MKMAEAINVSPQSHRRFDINLTSNWKVPVSSLGTETSYTELPGKYKDSGHLRVASIAGNAYPTQLTILCPS